MPPTLPPANLTGWQWIAMFAILSALTALQTWVLHRKIDSSKQTPEPVKNEEKPS